MRMRHLAAVAVLPIALAGCPSSTALAVVNEVDFVQTAINGVLPLAAALAALATGNPALMAAAAKVQDLTASITNGFDAIKAQVAAGQTVQAAALAGVEASLASLETLLITNGQPVPVAVSTAIAKAQGAHIATAALSAR